MTSDSPVGGWACDLRPPNRPGFVGDSWVREARDAKAGTAPTAAERAEIRELRAELERVTRERDILGKAVAYFSASHPKNV
jgi:hypothetical protein